MLCRGLTVQKRLAISDPGNGGDVVGAVATTVQATGSAWNCPQALNPLLSQEYLSEYVKAIQLGAIKRCSSFQSVEDKLWKAGVPRYTIIEGRCPHHDARGKQLGMEYVGQSEISLILGCSESQPSFRRAGVPAQ